MNITQNKEDNKLIVAVSGRVDTNTAPELDKALMEAIVGVNEFVLDFKDMNYISSAGLRVILKVHRRIDEKGSFKLINVSDDVMEVFDMIGFSDILNIE